MPITLRNTKGSPLTYTELDDNFLFLSSSYLPISATSSIQVVSSSFAVSASQAQNAKTASYVLNAVSASFVTSSSYAMSASQAQNTVSSSYPIAVNGSTIYTPFGAGDITTDNSIFLGHNAGSGSNNANSSNFLGYSAGYNAGFAEYSNFIGYNAGNGSRFARDSNFLGEFAGAFSQNAAYSNFLGQLSGYSASSAYFSNFLGTYSGRQASNAEYSNFMGYSAGDSAQYASYCTLLGYQAGYNVVSGAPGISANNIIIGTNITLKNSSRDCINLGGIIFGTGSYANPAGNPFSGSANGRVGINQPFPDYTLDVSGSGRFTNGIVSNPYGSRTEYASFGNLSTDTDQLSGSQFGYYLPPGYLTYYIFTNHSYNSVSTVYLYRLTSNGFNRSNPMYNSTITIINKSGGNVASITRNPSDTSVTINRKSTSESFTSCSLAPNSYITLFIEDGTSPDWAILNSGSLY